MELDLPIVGNDINYAQEFIANFIKLDTHDHNELGNTISQAGINWQLVNNGSYNFSNINKLNFTDVIPQKQSSLYTKNGDLYYTDGQDREIRITRNEGLDYTVSIAGFFGDFKSYDASVVFSSAANGTYTFFGGKSGTTVYCKTFTLSAGSTVKNLSVTFPVATSFQSKVPKSSTYTVNTNAAILNYVYFDKDGLISYAKKSLTATNNQFLQYDGFNLVSYIDCNQTTMKTGERPVDRPDLTPIIKVTGGTLSYARFNNVVQEFLFSKKHINGTFTTNFSNFCYLEVTPTFTPNGYCEIQWQITPDDEAPFPSSYYCPNFSVISRDKTKTYRIVDYREINFSQRGLTTFPQGYIKLLVKDSSNTIVTDYKVAISCLVYFETYP